MRTRELHALVTIILNGREPHRDPATMLENARRKALHLIETAPNQCPLSDAQRRELRRILDAADRELG